MCCFHSGLNGSSRNTGTRRGEEVVQLYINDKISSVTRPLMELKAFYKIGLAPGQSKTVEFTLTSDDLSFLNRQMERVVEPSVSKLMVGAASDDVRLSGTFEVHP